MRYVRRRITPEMVQKGLDTSELLLTRGDYTEFDCNNKQCLCPATAAILGFRRDLSFDIINEEGWEQEDGRHIDIDQFFQNEFGTFYIVGFTRAIDQNSYIDHHDYDYGGWSEEPLAADTDIHKRHDISCAFRQGFWDGTIINKNFNMEFRS